MVSPTCVTIGNFDGVHIGHQDLIRELVDTSQSRGLDSVVLTFDPHPSQVTKNVHRPVLTTIKEKYERMKSLGVDFLVVQTFNEEFSKLSPEDFLRHFLFPALRPEYILLGYDFRFGYKGAGDFQYLCDFSYDWKFESRQFEATSKSSVVVSSTRIRKALDQGDVSLAASLLGSNYSIGGLVIKGDQIGRTIHFPTANLSELVHYLPANGVYCGWARIDGGLAHAALLNIGYRPTIAADSDLRIECHLLDFDEDIYGRSVRFEFVDRIREEMSFVSLEELKKQIHRDSQTTRKRLIGEKA